MTAQEMQYHFELKLNQFHNVDKIFTSTDIAVFLNRAQDDLILDRYSKKNGNPLSYLENDEKTRTEIGGLIKNYVTTSFVSVDAALHANAKFATLPTDYLYSLQEMCVVSYTDCNYDSKTGTAKVLPVRHDEYMMNIENPFGQPYKKLVWRMDYGSTGTKRHELITASDNTIVSYTMRYLRKPTAIDIINGVDCILHDSVHEEIVDRAINIAISMIANLKKNVEPNIVKDEKQSN